LQIISSFLFFGSQFFYKNIIISVKTNPARVKYIPFLKIDDLGKNIQNDEITKNNKDKPKKIFKKYRGLLWVALCNFSILPKT